MLLEGPEELKRFKVLERSEKERKYNYVFLLEKYICNHCTVLRNRGRELEGHLREA